MNNHIKPSKGWFHARGGRSALGGKKIILAIILFASFAGMVKADFSLDKWQYVKNITGLKTGLNSVTLDSDVFANSNKGLADVRVINSANQEVPYKMLAAKSEDGRKDYHPRIINNSMASGKYSTAILDLGERGIITNSVTVQTTSENFQRNVTVYGSDDQNNWNVLKSNGYVYDYTDKKAGVKSQNTTVSFPESVFKFLKIEISDAENIPITIGSVTVNQFTQKKAQEFNVAATLETFQDSVAKTTVVLADLGQSGIPTNKLVLSIGTENFNRGISIYASNDKNSNNWKSVGQGYVFRYNTPKFNGENTTLSISETTDRYFKVVVYNNDNAPLNISEVRAFASYRELVFQAEAEEEYAIYYGNNAAKSPQYDLEKYFQYLDLSNAKVASLEKQQLNKSFIAEKQPEKPFTEKYPYMLTLALAMTGIILLGMVYKFLKK